MIIRRPLTVAFLALAAHLTVAPLAIAQGDSETAAIKAKADEAFDSNKFAEALDGYRSALTRGGDPRLHYNIAAALAAMGRYPEALTEYQLFLSDAPAGTLTEVQQKAFFTRLDELKAKISRIIVKCPVAGARVLVRDKVMGTTPLDQPLAVNAGSAKIEILMDGYRPFAVTVDLPGGGTHTVDAPLSRVDFTGKVEVSSSVAGAEVLIDGIAKGRTPFEARLEQGAHVITVRASGYVERNHTLTVEAGKTKTLSFTLDRKPDYSVAYLGFGIGIVGLGAGAATGFLALSRFDSAKDKCDTSARECGPAAQDDLRSSKTWALLSSVSFGVGLAGVGIGVYGLTRGGGSQPKPVDVVLVPGGLLLSGRF